MRRRTNSMTWISFRKPWQHLRVQLCIGIIKRNFSSTYLDTWGRTANLKDQGVSLYGSLTIIFHYFVSPFLRMTESFSVYYFSFHMFLLTFLWFHFNFRQKCTFNVFIKLCDPTTSIMAALSVMLVNSLYIGLAGPVTAIMKLCLFVVVLSLTIFFVFIKSTQLLI